MTWKTDISVWLEKPSVVQVFSDDGQEQDYVPEMTCRMSRVTDENRILFGWIECSECGPVYPPAAEAIQDAIRFCPYCGRKVEVGRK